MESSVKNTLKYYCELQIVEFNSSSIFSILSELVESQELKLKIDFGKAKDDKSEDYQDAMKLLHARVNNWESNLHIEIDMERIEDRSKALSYIGIEIADALKEIPVPAEEVKEAPVQAVEEVAEEYVPETFEVKPSLWQRFKNSKFVRAIKYVMSIRVVLDLPALPEGKTEN